MTPVFMRGVGGNSGCFAVESALDELAYELSVDPPSSCGCATMPMSTRAAAPRGPANG
jgi:hypothetical protein